MTKYLEMDADTREDIEQYYRVRSTEIGETLIKVIQHSWGEYLALFLSGARSLYIPESLRGQGILKEYRGEN